jgi:hypothetical protein
MISSKLKSNFANNYLQNQRKRSNFGLNLTILCQFLVAIPDRSNLPMFDHTFKCPYAVKFLSFLIEEG